MSVYDNPKELKDYIKTEIKSNNEKNITATVLQNIVTAIVMYFVNVSDKIEKLKQH